MTDFRIHAATLDGVKLPGCTGYAAEAGRQVAMFGTSGSPHRRLVAAGRYAQAISLTTGGLKTLLSKMLAASAAPIPCASLATGTGLVIAASAVDPVLPADTAGAAELLTVARGLMCLRSLSWQQAAGGVTCDVGVWPLSVDGQASGWSTAQGPIPALPTAEEDYDLHSITWKGGALDGLTGFQLGMSSNPQVEYNPGAIYPSFIRQAPATGNFAIDASFTLPDRAALRTYGEHFHGGAAGDLVVKFRPFAQAAARDSTAGNEVTFTLSGVAEVTGASDGDPGSVQVNVHGMKADGTSPLTWSVGV